MADLRITKQASAQRQLDAAIRMLFSGEDILAVHTVASASLGVLSDLDKASNNSSLEPYAETLAELKQRIPDVSWPSGVAEFKQWLQKRDRSGANFLKHADRDSAKSLDPSSLTTDHVILEACTTYAALGLPPTTGMRAFCRWHVAIYPTFDEDRIRTEFGDPSEFDRAQQLEFGSFLLNGVFGR